MARPKEKGGFMQQGVERSVAFENRAKQELDKLRVKVAKALEDDCLCLFEQGEHADLIITNGVNEIKAHKCVLEARARHLWQESWISLEPCNGGSDSKLRGKITLTGLSEKQMSDFVRQLYVVSDSALLVEEFLSFFPNNDKKDVCDDDTTLCETSGRANHDDASHTTADLSTDLNTEGLEPVISNQCDNSGKRVEDESITVTNLSDVDVLGHNSNGTYADLTSEGNHSVLLDNNVDRIESSCLVNDKCIIEYSGKGSLSVAENILSNSNLPEGGVKCDDKDSDKNLEDENVVNNALANEKKICLTNRNDEEDGKLENGKVEVKRDSSKDVTTSALGLECSGGVVEYDVMNDQSLEEGNHLGVLDSSQNQEISEESCKINSAIIDVRTDDSNDFIHQNNGKEMESLVGEVCESCDDIYLDSSSGVKVDNEAHDLCLEDIELENSSCVKLDSEVHFVENEATSSVFQIQSVLSEAIKNSYALSVPYDTCNELGRDLLRMYLQQKNCDICLCVDGVRFLAHKCVLAARSSYFSAMLGGKWSESEMEEIELQGVSAQAMEQILLFLYGGVMELCTPSDLMELFIIMDMYRIDTLKQVLEFYIRKDLCHFFHKPCNACILSASSALNLCHSFYLEDLEERCLKWSIKYFTKIWSNKSFASLPDAIHQKCVQSVLSSMTEKSVLDVIIECNNLSTSLPRIKWTESILYLTSQLMDSAIEYTSSHFIKVIRAPEFLQWGKVATWKAGALEEIFNSAIDSLPIDTACSAYQTLVDLKATQAALEDVNNQDILDLLDLMVKRCEKFLRTHIHQVARSKQWSTVNKSLQSQILENSAYIHLDQLPDPKPRPTKRPLPLSSTRPPRPSSSSSSSNHPPSLSSSSSSSRPSTAGATAKRSVKGSNNDNTLTQSSAVASVRQPKIKAVSVSAFTSSREIMTTSGRSSVAASSLHNQRSSSSLVSRQPLSKKASSSSSLSSSLSSSSSTKTTTSLFKLSSSPSAAKSMKTSALKLSSSSPSPKPTKTSSTKLSSSLSSSASNLKIDGNNSLKPDNRSKDPKTKSTALNSSLSHTSKEIGAKNIKAELNNKKVVSYSPSSWRKIPQKNNGNISTASRVPGPKTPVAPSEQDKKSATNNDLSNQLNTNTHLDQCETSEDKLLFSETEASSANANFVSENCEAVGISMKDENHGIASMNNDETFSNNNESPVESVADTNNKIVTGDGNQEGKDLVNSTSHFDDNESIQVDVSEGNGLGGNDLAMVDNNVRLSECVCNTDVHSEVNCCVEGVASLDVTHNNDCSQSELKRSEEDSQSDLPNNDDCTQSDLPHKQNDTESYLTHDDDNTQLDSAHNNNNSGNCTQSNFAHNDGHTESGLALNNNNCTQSDLESTDNQSQVCSDANGTSSQSAISQTESAPQLESNNSNGCSDDHDNNDNAVDVQQKKKLVQTESAVCTDFVEPED